MVWLIAEGCCSVIADPLPHHDGADDLGVEQQVALVDLLCVDADGAG